MLKFIFTLALLSPSLFADCIDAPAEICRAELEVLSLVNEYRYANRLAGLEPSAHLSFVARAWSISQAESGRISHRGFSSERLKAYKQNFPLMPPVDIRRENVAMFCCEALNPEAVAKKFHTMWINSPGHDRNIKANDIGKLGVGIYRNEKGAYYATELFSD